MTDNDPISWRAIVYGTPVMASDGTKLGTVKEVLGSDEEDIFHGIRVATDGHHDVMLPASNTSELTAVAVTADLSVGRLPRPAGIRRDGQLPPFDGGQISQAPGLGAGLEERRGTRLTLWWRHLLRGLVRVPLASPTR